MIIPFADQQPLISKHEGKSAEKHARRPKQIGLKASTMYDLDRRSIGADNPVRVFVRFEIMNFASICLVTASQY